MAGKSRYHHVKFGEWIQPRMRGFKDMCCDCGLVHTVDFRVVDGRVQFKVRTDGRATGGARKHNGVKVTPKS